MVVNNMRKYNYVFALSFIFTMSLIADVKVYPVPQLFLSSAVKQNSNFKNALTTEKGSDNLVKGRKFFLNAMNKVFRIEKTITRKNINKTFVAYVKVPRVSLYKVEKTPQRANYYLPITATFTIANMKSGEILYSEAYTNYTVYEGLTSGIDDATQKSVYMDGMQNTIEELTQKAEVKFSPFTINSKIIDKYEQYYILDKGRDSGIVLDDSFESMNGSEIKIIYSDKDYSVAKVELGKVNTSEEVSKVSTGSINSIKRPKVGLVDNNIEYSGFSWDTIKQFLTDKIGEKASFSILPLDRTFYEAQDFAFRNSSISQEYRNKRVVPNSFIKLNIGKLYSWRTPTDQVYTNFDNYAVNACALMSNRAGIITYSSCSTELRKDVTYGKSRFSNDAVSEIVTKNAILKTAEDFSKYIKPLTKKATIVSIKNDQVTLDSKDLFKRGDNPKVFHNIGDVEGIDDIKIIVAETIINDDDTSTATVLDFPEKVNVGDELILETLEANPQEKLLKFGETINMSKQKLSQLEMMAPYIIAKNTKYSCLIWDDLKEDFENSFSSSLGFKRNLKIQKPKTEFIITPRYEIRLTKTKCQQSMCESLYNLYVDVKVYKGKQETKNIVFKNGLEVNINILHTKNNDEKIDFELTKEAVNLLRKISAGIKL